MVVIASSLPIRRLVDLLEEKFGPLDRKTRARVHRADMARLRQWGKRILTAERLEQGFAE